MRLPNPENFQIFKNLPAEQKHTLLRAIYAFLSKECGNFREGVGIMGDREQYSPYIEAIKLTAQNFIFIHKKTIFAVHDRIYFSLTEEHKEELKQFIPQIKKLQAELEEEISLRFEKELPQLTIKDKKIFIKDQPVFRFYEIRPGMFYAENLFWTPHEKLFCSDRKFLLRLVKKIILRDLEYHQQFLRPVLYFYTNEHSL